MAVLTGELVVIHTGVDFVTESYRLYRTPAAALSTEVKKVETQKNNKCQYWQRHQCDPFSHPIYLSFWSVSIGKFVPKLSKTPTIYIIPRKSVKFRLRLFIL
jgi:hypothetical protein